MCYAVIKIMFFPTYLATTQNKPRFIWEDSTSTAWLRSSISQATERVRVQELSRGFHTC